MPRKSIELRILDRLKEGPANMRDMHRATGNNYPTALIQGCLADLCERGIAQEEYIENGRGRPSITHSLV